MIKDTVKFILPLLLFPLLITAAPHDKIAVLNLRNTEGVSTGEAELLSDRLRNDLFSTGKVEVMERDQMQSILAEQGLQQSGVTCTDEGCMVEFGKLLGVKKLISGSIGKLGSLFMINTKSIDVQTGQLLKVVSKDVHGDIEDVVEILPAIAAELTGASAPAPKPTVEKIVAPPQPRTTETDLSPLPCDGSIYIEKIRFPKNIISFPVPGDDADDIDQNLAEVLGEALDRSVVTASAAQIAASDCKTIVIRIVLTGYEVRPDVMKQFNGTIFSDISVFASPKHETPAVTVKFKNTGDRHWGDITPLKNAFDELVDSIDDDFYSAAKKALKQIGFRR